jgi:hypothetical protein
MTIPSQLNHSLIALIDGGSVVGVVVGVAKAFEWLDGMVNDAGREALSNQLRDAPSDERMDSWATVFPKLIDTVFGKRPLSWTFFVRSCIASVLAVSVVTLIRFRLAHETVPTVPEFGIAAALFLLFVSLANFIPDYVSLLISRVIVKMMVLRNTTTNIFALLVLDTLLTAIVATFSVLVVLLAFEMTDVIVSHRVPLWNTVLDYWQSGEWLRLTRGGEGIFFYSAFFTSIWVWLYVLSIVVIKLLHHARAIWVKLTPYLDIEKKPLVAIGRVAGLLAGAGYAVILGFIWIGSHWH